MADKSQLLHRKRYMSRTDAGSSVQSTELQKLKAAPQGASEAREDIEITEPRSDTEDGLCLQNSRCGIRGSAVIRHDSILADLEPEMST
jgi:hypothetical protein